MEDYRNEEQSGFSTVPEPEITNTNLGTPEVTDCLADTIPAGTKPESGKKKIQARKIRRTAVKNISKMRMVKR